MRNILIVEPHSDDAALSMGGTIFKLVQSKNVHVVICSDSVYTNYNGDVCRTEEQVKTETAASMTALGVSSYEFLTYKTKHIPSNSDFVEQLDKIMDVYNIDTIFTPASDDYHLDHKNVGEVVLAVSRKISNVYAFEPVFPAKSISLFKPQIYVDISKQPFERKILALMAHKSQYQRYGNKWLDSVRSLSRIRGIEIGVTYAESFCVIKGIMEI